MLITVAILKQIQQLLDLGDEPRLGTGTKVDGLRSGRHERQERLRTAASDAQLLGERGRQAWRCRTAVARKQGGACRAQQARQQRGVQQASADGM